MAIFAHHKPNLGDTRLLADKKAVFKKAADLFSLKEGIGIVISLLGTPIEEVYSVTKFDPNTGEPLTFDWKLSKPWTGLLPYRYLWRGSGTDYDNLLETLKDVIPVGELRVLKLKDDQCVTIIHHPFGFDSPEKGRHFSLIKTVILP